MKYIIIIMISSMVGYLTNKIAILLIFRPYNRKKFLPYISPGIIPKSKKELAYKVSEVLKKKILTNSRIKKKIIDAFPYMEFIDNMNPGFIEEIIYSLRIQAIAKESINRLSNKEIENMIRDITDQYFTYIEILGGVIGFLIGITECFMIF